MKMFSCTAAGILMAMLSGCVSSQVSLAEKGDVSITTKAGDTVKIMGVDVYQQEGRTWAYGMLKQKGGHSGAVKTHVDVLVLSCDGTIQYEIFSEDIYVPCSRPGRGTDWKRFKVQLPDQLTHGARVSMIVCGETHTGRI